MQPVTKTSSKWRHFRFSLVCLDFCSKFVIVVVEYRVYWTTSLNCSTLKLRYHCVLLTFWCRCNELVTLINGFLLYGYVFCIKMMPHMSMFLHWTMQGVKGGFYNWSFALQILFLWLVTVLYQCLVFIWCTCTVLFSFKEGILVRISMSLSVKVVCSSVLMIGCLKHRDGNVVMLTNFSQQNQPNCQQFWQIQPMTILSLTYQQHETFVADFPGRCHFDNFLCSQWRKSRQHYDLAVSVKPPVKCDLECNLWKPSLSLLWTDIKISISRLRWLCYFIVHPSMSLLPDKYNCGLRVRPECRERFPRHRLQRKPLVSDPGMHYGSCRDACRDR